MPMITRQKMMMPTIVMPGEAEDRAWASVAKMMNMSSMPYMRLRPTMSARMPKPTWPMTVPPAVATLIAVSALTSIEPPK